MLVRIAESIKMEADAIRVPLVPLPVIAMQALTLGSDVFFFANPLW